MRWQETLELGKGVMCARCEARPGQDCVTISGGRSSRSHSARTTPVLQGWRAGYQDALEMAAAHPEAFKRQVTRHTDT